MKRAVVALVVAGCAPKAQGPALDAERALAEAHVRKGQLVLACGPSDAAVYIDGVEQGACSDFGAGRGLSLGEGMHRVEVKKPGFAPYQTFIDPENTRASLSVELTPRPSAGETR